MTAGHVFISHGSENHPEAEELCAFIESHGIRTWIAPRDVRPGMDYSEQLQSAIEGCLAFVVLVTETANSSPYVRAETEMAFSNNKPIFPVRQSEIMPAAGLAFFLKIRHWTDAYGANAKAGMDRLAQELRALAGLGPEGASPTPTPVAEVPAVRPPPAPAPSPAAKAGLPKSTLIAMGAAGALIVAVLIFFLVQQSRSPVIPAPVPTPAPSPSPDPAPEPAPTPATASIDRGLLVGRWGVNGDCANGLEFTDDGRVLTVDGTAGGVWTLNGDVMTVTTNNGEQHTARINSVDQSALYSTDASGTVEVSQRC